MNHVEGNEGHITTEHTLSAVSVFFTERDECSTSLPFFATHSSELLFECCSSERLHVQMRHTLGLRRNIHRSRVHTAASAVDSGNLDNLYAMLFLKAGQKIEEEPGAP